MNVRGRDLGGCMEYGRSVLLRRDPGPWHRNVHPTVFQRIGIVRMIPLFTPPDRAERSSVPVQITLRNKKVGKTMPIKKLDSSWWALRIGLGLAAVLAGVDKFFNLLTNWNMYLSPLAERFLPVSGHTFMLITGPIEILVGLSILTRWTRIGAYVLSVWLLAIALNLVTTGSYYDVAVRDVEMAIAAFVLANLTEVRESVARASSFTSHESPRPVAAA